MKMNWAAAWKRSARYNKYGAQIYAEYAASDKRKIAALEAAVAKLGAEVQRLYTKYPGERPA